MESYSATKNLQLSLFFCSNSNSLLNNVIQGVSDLLVRKIHKIILRQKSYYQTVEDIIVFKYKKSLKLSNQIIQNLRVQAWHIA